MDLKIFKGTQDGEQRANFFSNIAPNGPLKGATKVGSMSYTNRFLLCSS